MPRSRSFRLLLTLSLLLGCAFHERGTAQRSSGFEFRPDGVRAFAAANAPHRLGVRVAPDGVEIWSGRAESERVRMRLDRIRRADASVAVERGEASARDERAEIARLELGLVEWYENGPRGVEQGFTFAKRPLAGDGEVVLRIAVDAGRADHPAPGANTLRLVDPNARDAFHYAKLVVVDAAGRELPARMGASGDEIEIRFDDRGARYPVVVDPIVSSPVWAPEGSGGLDFFARSAMTAGDINCDGISDLVIGNPQDDPFGGGSDAGTLNVWFGSTGPLPTNPFETPDWIANGPIFGNNLGHSVAGIGDVNGDGCDDLLAGAAFGNTTAESVHLYLGQAPNGPSTTSVWRATGFPHVLPSLHTQMGHAVTGGDLNGDGLADIVVTQLLGSNGQTDEGVVFVWLGNANIAAQADGTSANADWRAECNAASCRFGESISSGADVNGDGFDDLVVGAPEYAGQGAAFGWYGGASFAADADGTPNNADWSHFLGIPGARTGAAVVVVGDMDGDGFADVAVGSPLIDGGGPLVDAGFASVTRGSASGLGASASRTFIGASPNGQLGAALASAGDANGDGRADLLIGEPRAPISSSAAGRAYLHLGSATVFSSISPPAATYQEPNTINGVGELARFGATVGTAGDLNADGLSDVIVGAPEFGLSRWGKAWVYLGGTESVALASGHTREQNQAEAIAGIGLGYAGDVNGDGFSDYVVGASQWDGGHNDEGRFDVVYGGSCGPLCAPIFLLPPDAFEGNEAGAHMGASVSGAGDVNGDGFHDVIVGAPETDLFVFPGGARPDAGNAYIYHGSTGGLPFTPTLGLPGGSQSNAALGTSVASAGDLNGDGYGDVAVGAPNFDFAPLADNGRVYVYYGSASGIVSASVHVITGNEGGGKLGTTVASAGDVNRDGYSDLLIGAPLEGASDEGRAYLHLGGAQGVNPIPVRTYSGEGFAAEFGAAVAHAGDLNADGYSDFLIGSPGLNAGITQNQGRFYVYLGGATPPAAHVTSRDGEFSEFGWPDSRLGIGVSSAGDVNGDGLSDIIVGAHWYGGPAGFAQGRAYVYHGDATTGHIAVAPARILEDCGTSYCDYGVRVAQAGDSNGDGFSDVVVSAFKYTNGHLYEGGSFLHFGNGGPGISRIRQQYGPPGIVSLLGNGGTNPLPFAFTRSPAGRAHTKLETQSTTLGSAFPGSTHVNDSLGTLGQSFLGGQGLYGSMTCPTAQACKWRARIRTRSPLFPATPWFTLPGNAATETDLRSSPPDGDGDGIADVADNCPTLANPAQVDGDADGVGNDCDNCTIHANPRMGIDFLGNNGWGTLSGRQRDDDHDGYGNRCDAKFAGGLLVGATDLVQFRASNGKNRTGDTCGTSGVRPCAIFDLDESGLLISATDLTVFRLLNGKAAGPRCATHCTGNSAVLPCEAGPTGTCGPVP